MRYYFLPILCVIAAPFASGQSLADLPSCAQQAALAGIESTGCSVSDIACVCKSAPFLTGLRSTITTACSPSDQAKALSFAQTLCSNVGVAITGPAISSTTSSTPMAAAAVGQVTPVSPSSSMTGATTRYSGTATSYMASGGSSMTSSSSTMMMSGMSSAVMSSSLAAMASSSSTTTEPAESRVATATPSTAQYTGGAMVFGPGVAAAIVGVAGAFVAAI